MSSTLKYLVELCSDCSRYHYSGSSARGKRHYTKITEALVRPISELYRMTQDSTRQYTVRPKQSQIVELINKWTN